MSLSSPLGLALVTWLTAALLMVALWAVQRRTRDAGIADVGWAAGLAGASALYALLGEGDPSRRVLLAGLAGVWGLRLAGHILFDRVLRGGEDGRYQRMRAHWGERADWGFLWFFQAQALFIVVFAVPMLIVAFNPRPGWGLWEWCAVALWILSIGGEWLADRQLAQFRAEPGNRGRTCRMGLWRFSRHPNYFFEWLHWWVYVALGVGSPWAWATLLGPALMLLFLFRVTGIPHTERQAMVSRGDDYRDYQRTTSVFIPWFPKEAAR